MSLLTDPVIENSHILANLLYLFEKIVLGQTSRSFNIKFRAH